MQIVPYLSFDGRCEEAFRFYAEVLGGEVTALMRYADAPPEMEMPETNRQQVMHAQVEFAGQTLMGADCAFGHQGEPAGINVHLIVDTPEEAERAFAGLMAGGTIGMPIAETFWAHRFGAGRDRFGIPWMVNCLKDCGGEG